MLFVFVVEGCVITRFNKNRLNVKANRLCLCKGKNVKQQKINVIIRERRRYRFQFFFVCCCHSDINFT